MAKSLPLCCRRQDFRSRIFKNGRNQAIRIPRELELSVSEATIHREGNRLIIEPVERTSIVVACELRFGARKKNAPLLTARIEGLLQTIEVLPLDGDVDRAYAEVRAMMLEAAGRPSGANDLLIAAHAVNEDCILVTNNESEFVRVAGLAVENWLAS